MPDSLASMLAHAQQCARDAPFLDAGRTEHARLAADVEQLVALVCAIRRTATRSVPNYINLVEIDRLLSTLAHA